MKYLRTGVAVTGLILLSALGTTGCTKVMIETAKKAMEDRVTEDQVKDTQIGTGILSSLSGKDMGLLLDVNVDVWEQRVMLTGTLDNPQTRQDVLQMVRADSRVRKIYDEIQIVTKAEKEQRREAAKKKDESTKEGAEQTVNDFWIETKISAQLVSARGVTSVNYRWRSVRNTVYLIGRARSQEELNIVLGTIRATEGVSLVKDFVEIKPLSKS
jgi:osmotically-inducible protein OsmY